MIENVAIIGSSGALGHAFTKQIATQYPKANIHAFSRTDVKPIAENIKHHIIDYNSESSIAQAAADASTEFPLDVVIVTTGILHDGETYPEKSLKEISEKNFKHLFEVNTIIPALIAKHFIPKLHKSRRSLFAALSARVGSISDNQLGGWYAYRASKAALNMIIKNLAIETHRSNQHAIIITLHPGTVDSPLSKPFQKNVPKEKLFTPEYSVSKMIQVLASLTTQDSGKCFAWDGEEIKP